MGGSLHGDNGVFSSSNNVPPPILSPVILERLLSAAAALTHAPIQPVHAATRLRGFSYSSIGTFLEGYLPSSYESRGSRTGTILSSSSSSSSFASSLDAKAMSSDPGDHASQLRQIKALLAKQVPLLTEALSRDACEGPLIWRLNALSCLCRVYSLLAAPEDNASIAIAARHLQRTGRLSQLVQHSVFGNDPMITTSARGGSSSSSSTGSASTSRENSTATSVLSLCCHLVGVPEGHAAVCEAFTYEGIDIYQRLASLFAAAGSPPFVTRSFSSTSAAAAAGLASSSTSSYGDEDETGFEKWCIRIRPILTLMRALATTDSSSVRSMDSCAYFVHVNYAAISKIMAMQWDIANVIATPHPSTSTSSHGHGGGGAGVAEQTGGSVVSHTPNATCTALYNLRHHIASQSSVSILSVTVVAERVVAARRILYYSQRYHQWWWW